MIWARDDCTILGAGAHPRYAEPDENESMVCDTATFDVPALWIRDAVTNTVNAYQVPGGYCPQPSRLARPDPPAVPVNVAVEVCTRLTVPSRGVALADRPVTLDVAGRRIAAGQTDADGWICASYRAGTPGPRPLLARFAGDLAYLPSEATGTLLVSGPGNPPTGPNRGVPPDQLVDPVQPSHRPAPQPAPGQAPAPQPATQPQVQVQPNPQAQPNPQPQAHGQVAMVPQPQEQVQTSRAGVGRRRDLESSRYRPRRRSPERPPYALWAGVTLALAGALVPARRLAPARR